MINLSAAIMMLIATIIGAFGAVCLKKGCKRILSFNFHLILGIFLYAMSALIYLIALKKEKLSVLYPIVSIGYVWISLFSTWFLGEKMNKFKWMGILLIVLGVILIGFGS